MRRSPGTASRSTSRSTRTGRSRSPTTAAACRSTSTPRRRSAARADPHAAARWREVHRQDLQILRRPARRRCIGGQCALEAPRVLDQARRQGIQHRLQGRQGRTRSSRRSAPSASATPVPRCASGPTRSSSTPTSSRCPQLKHTLKAKAVLCPGLRISFQERGHGREGRVVLHRRPRRLPGRGTRSQRAHAARAHHRHHTARTTTRSTTRCAGRPNAERADRRKLRQPDPDHRGRHARQRPARRRGAGGARVLRVPQPACRAASSSRPRTSGTRPTTCCR